MQVWRACLPPFCRTAGSTAISESRSRCQGTGRRRCFRPAFRRPARRGSLPASAGWCRWCRRSRQKRRPRRSQRRRGSRRPPPPAFPPGRSAGLRRPVPQSPARSGGRGCFRGRSPRQDRPSGRRRESQRTAPQGSRSAQRRGLLQRGLPPQVRCWKQAPQPPSGSQAQRQRKQGPVPVRSPPQPCWKQTLPPCFPKRPPWRRSSPAEG